MDVGLAEGYISQSQIIRVISEKWLADNGYCPTCGGNLSAAKANSKVLDFECSPCAHEFELKSQRIARALNRINDGAYSSMMERIMDPNSPHFFFLGYDSKYLVTNLMAVPNYLFQASVIQQRKPLAATARRAGWIGCNILLDQIPEVGKIKLVKNGEIISQELVIKNWGKTTFLGQQKQIVARGWIVDVIKCIERLQTKEFNLESIYRFESELALKHPGNNFIKDKIRQQLQLLRDKGYLDFVKPGHYKLTE